MSVDRLKRFFSKTVMDSEHSSSLGPQDSVVEPEMTATVVQPLGRAATVPAVSTAADSGSQITLPVLGTRPVVQHQQILLTGLAVALVLMGAVAAFALSVSGRIGQQMGATGQSLMQSQRLAKSVSQDRKSVV